MSDTTTAASSSPSKTSSSASTFDFARLCVANPLRLMDELGDGQAIGNTPRPSDIDKNYMEGQRLLQSKKFRDADRCLKAAMEEAHKAVTGGGGGAPHVPTALDFSRMGYTCAGRGFLFVCINEMRGAEQLYRKALQCRLPRVSVLAFFFPAFARVAAICPFVLNC
jgi:hypothetical protein